MQKDYDRGLRMGDVVHRSIAQILAKEFKDPRIGMVTVAEVSMSKDLSHAKIFVTVLEDDKRDETLKILNGATGFFRTRLAKLVKMRLTPTVHFHYDSSVSTGRRIDEILGEPHPNPPPWGGGRKGGENV